MAERWSAGYLLLKALKSPARVLPASRRLLLNRRIRSVTRDHTEFYARIVDKVASEDPFLAVGSRSMAEWEAFGRMHFDYFVQKGLQPDHRYLDIGCGNLRTGQHVIDFLGESQYTGVDISPQILKAALSTMISRNLQAKRPRLFLVASIDYGFLPAADFDVAYAHSVFSHMELAAIQKCLLEVRRVIKPDGFFDFTFNQSVEGEGDFFAEDFYYRLGTIEGVLKASGYRWEVMEDFDHPQTRVRAYPAIEGGGPS